MQEDTEALAAKVAEMQAETDRIFRAMSQEQVVALLGNNLGTLIHLAEQYVDPVYLASRLKHTPEPTEATESCVLLLLQCLSVHIAEVQRGSQDASNTL